MRPRDLLLRIRSRPVWRDPDRKVKTLESFSRTETDGGRDLLGAARRVADPWLRENFERHARDELRHGDLFRARARELRAATGAAPEAEPERLYDLARGRPSAEVDAHGFFKAGLFEELGEVHYVAMLHVAEKRAAAIFRVHRDLTRDDPQTSRIFEDILQDERYHVAYTGKALERWRKEGRGRQVREALSRARGSRAIGALKRLALRGGARFGGLLLLLVYATVVVPFGTIARLARLPRGWRPAPGRPGLGGARSQS